MLYSSLIPSGCFSRFPQRTHPPKGGLHLFFVIVFLALERDTFFSLTLLDGARL